MKFTQALCVAIALSTTSCAYWNRVKPDLASCAAGVVPAALADLENKAMKVILGNDTQSWQDFARAELVQYGVAAATCIVIALVHDINAPVPPTAMARKASGKNKTRALARANAWLEANGK